MASPRFTDAHQFVKPNDIRGLHLMNKCAQACMLSFSDIIMAYGESDEYSFVLRKDSVMYSRRESKISTSIVSCFAANYVFHWAACFPDTVLQYAPQFDSRVVCYPSLRNLRDYFSWRQADCLLPFFIFILFFPFRTFPHYFSFSPLTADTTGHINNLYNTTFWALVQKGGLTTHEAEQALVGSFAADKNEILFGRFGINYNNEPEMMRKGSTVLRLEHEESVVKMCPKSKDDPTLEGRTVTRKRRAPAIVHLDMIGDAFWTTHAELFPADD
jgi:tRNA(His) guanylyltransferase